ncbi:MAG: glutamate-5-semialdehyde dehydrogenase [Clostridia bacterium]|nr:glutamate-5-semialdehyde dehydrogenase [Clostridia bacterium]MDD4047502.1 glutamate-5-semialdehyde dehydrogenase [Clostridia bacterium]
MDIKEKAKLSKESSLTLSTASSEIKNEVLKNLIKELQNNEDEIIKANKFDIERSEKEKLPKPLIKRLKFDHEKICGVVDGINSLIELPDPVGKTLAATELDQGLELYKISCPIGVVGVIFESRPDALVQISTLCLKSGNGVLLKGGSEAKETNKILTTIIMNATKKAGLPSGWVQLIETREDVNEMLKMDEYINLLIPRGSNAFVKYIMENSNIPVLGHADGVCHSYIHDDADINRALNILIDAKTQYPAACNATETVLVHSNIAKEFLPLLKEKFNKMNVELYGCEKTRKIIDVTPVEGEDWHKEYLDYKLSIKVVEGLDEAINHINTFGSGHTEAIIATDKKAIQKFMDLVDASNVFSNCSTRFSDGFRYGFGAEVGISTSKIHARGPVGLEGLLIYKYKLFGNGDIVEDYASRKKIFTHKKIER